jgi:hypothetical protein
MVIWTVVNRITKIIFDHLNDKFLNQIIFNYETSYIAEKFFLKPTSFFLKTFICMWNEKVMNLQNYEIQNWTIFRFSLESFKKNYHFEIILLRSYKIYY